MRHAEVNSKEELAKHKGESAFEIWDADFILEKLSPTMQIRKIYVSGPPRMNFALEAALELVH